MSQFFTEGKSHPSLWILAFYLNRFWILFLELIQGCFEFRSCCLIFSCMDCKLRIEIVWICLSNHWIWEAWHQLTIIELSTACKYTYDICMREDTCPTSQFLLSSNPWIKIVFFIEFVQQCELLPVSQVSMCCKEEKNQIFFLLSILLRGHEATADAIKSCLNLFGSWIV